MENRVFEILSSKEKKFVTDLSRKENITIITTLNRLFRVFIGFLMFSILMTGIGIYEFMSGSIGDFYGFLFAWLVIMFLIVILTPIKIGVKILIGKFK